MVVDPVHCSSKMQVKDDHLGPWNDALKYDYTRNTHHPRHYINEIESQLAPLLIGRHYTHKGEYRTVESTVSQPYFSGGAVDFDLYGSIRRRHDPTWKPRRLSLGWTFDLPTQDDVSMTNSSSVGQSNFPADG